MGRNVTSEFEKAVLADGRAVLYRGDCLEIMRQIEPVSAVITDPPYASGGLFRSDRIVSATDKYVQHGTKIKRCDFSHEAKDQRSYTSWCAEWLSRLPLIEGGYACSFIDWRQLPAMSDAFQWSGLIWRGIVSWDKGRGARAPHKGYFKHQTEYIVWGTRGKCKIATHGGPFDGAYRHKVLQSDKHHIVGKPTALMRDLVKIVPNDAVVFDPFAGSGTTGVACLAEGRRFIGVEIDPGHFAAARARIEAWWAEHGRDTPGESTQQGAPNA